MKLAEASDSLLPVDAILKLANAGLPAIAIVVLILTYRAVREAVKQPAEYQKLVRTFMIVSIVIVFISFVSSIIAYFRPVPPVITADLLQNGQWHQHWGGGNWVTEARFEPKDDGMHFRAATYRVVDGSMKGRRIIEWWSDGPVDITAKKMTFKGKRKDLENGAVMPTRYEFVPGLALVGDYGGLSDGLRHKLRFYDAVDDGVKEVRRPEELDRCICEAKDNRCATCQR